MHSASASRRLTGIVDAFVGLAVLAFFTGGIAYQGALAGKRRFVEISDWGYALAPIFFLALWLGPRALARSSSWHAIRSLWTSARLGIAAAPVRSWLLVFTPMLVLQLRTVLSRHWSFNSDWDLAIYANACSHGFYSSLRDQTTLLADHFEPLLAFFMPACKVFDPATTLIVGQTTALFVGAAGITTLCRRMRWSWVTSFVAGLIYVFFRGNRGIIIYDFHLMALALGVMPWMFVAIVDRRWWLFGLLALSYAGLKESAALTLAALGAWLVLEKDEHWGGTHARRVVGLTLGILGLATFAAVMLAVFPYARDGAESVYFAKYYGHLGSNLSEVARTFVFRPGAVLEHLADLRKLQYMLLILAPFLFLPLLRPVHWLPILPTLAINLLSSHDFLYSGRFHYEAEIYPILFSLTIIATRDATMLRRWRKVPGFRLLGLRTAWLAIMVALFGGKSLAWYSSSYPPSNLHIVIREKLAELEPQIGDESVAAFEPLVPHLAGLRNVFTMNRWRDADWVIVAYPHGKGSWATTFAEVETEMAPRLDATHNIVYQDQWHPTFRVWHRKPKP